MWVAKRRRWVTLGTLLFGLILLLTRTTPALALPPDETPLLAPSANVPDASAAAPYCGDYVRNGSFEFLSFLYWTVGGTPQYWSSGGHTGWHSALLGGTNQAVDGVFQEIPCPYYGERVITHAWVYMSTQDPLTFADWLQLASYHSNGTGAWNYYYSNAPAESWWQWTHQSNGPGVCQPGDYWTVRFRAETDGSAPTWFFLDDVSLEVCCADDPREPNNGFAAASAVTPGAYSFRLCPETDEEWFRFDAATGQIINLGLHIQELGHATVCLISPTGQEKGCNSGNYPQIAPIVVTADETGSWRARVLDPGYQTKGMLLELSIQLTDPAAPTATVTPTPTRTLQATPTHTGVAPPTLTRTPAPSATPTSTRTITPWPTLPGGVRRLRLPLITKAHWLPRPGECTELLRNGNFEGGGLTSWSRIGDVSAGPGRQSANGAILGGVNNAVGELWQHIEVPAGANYVPWTLWWKAEAAGSPGDDILMVRLECEGEEPALLTFRPTTPLDDWRAIEADLSPWAGKRLLAGFLVRTDAAVPTTFRIDDVSILACVRP